MGFVFVLIKKVFKWLLYFLIFSAIIVLIPNLPPYISFTKFEIDASQPLVGPLAINGLLNNAEKLYDGKLLGPEAFQLHKGEVYTSLLTGEIVKLSAGGHVTFVTKIGKPCTDTKQEHICGRPLGFEIDKNDQLYVADAYYGIWKVDLKTDKKQLLVSPNKEIDGQVPKLFNSVALDKQGNLYWTDSSSEFLLKDGAYTLLADPTGRLFKYDAAKNQSTVLIDKLWFANGLAVSPDDQFVVVAECYANKLHKYYINGPKKGKSEVFVTGLPGTPDNLRSLPDGSGVLVGLFTVFDDESPAISRSLAATPHARKFLARIQRLVEVTFEFLNEQYPHVFFEDVIYSIGHFKSLSGLTSKLTGLLQIDWNGNIVAAYYNNDGSSFPMSDAIVFNDKLYIGSPHSQDFIAAIPAPELLKKAFTAKTSNQRGEVKKEVPKTETPAKSAQKPKPVDPVKVATPPIKDQKVPNDAKPAPQATKPVVKAPKQAPPPAEKKPETPKQQEKVTPKPQQEKPTTPSKPTDNVKTTTPKPTTPKPTTPKPTEKKVSSTTNTPTEPTTKSTPKPSAKPAQEKEVPKQAKPNIPKTGEKGAPQQIPIKEEIPSDTVKPNKENLKVIKKDGPTEIPNPNL